MLFFSSYSFQSLSGRLALLSLCHRVKTHLPPVLQDTGAGGPATVAGIQKSQSVRGKS